MFTLTVFKCCFLTAQTNKEDPSPAATFPNHSPPPLTLHIIPPSLLDDHCPKAPTTAIPSPLGTLIQQSLPCVLRRSIGIAVPVRPRYCWRAVERQLRAVRLSSCSDPSDSVGPGTAIFPERRLRWKYAYGILRIRILRSMRCLGEFIGDIRSVSTVTGSG